MYDNLSLHTLFGNNKMINEQMLVEINFRRATAGDLETLADLRWRLCTNDVLSYDPIKKKQFIDLFCAKMRKNRSNIQHFIAEKNKKIIACMSLITINKIPDPENIRDSWGYLTNVYVLPEYRNKDIGSTLLRYIKFCAQEKGQELIIVWPSDNSYAFYEREGFVNHKREQDPVVLVLRQ